MPGGLPRLAALAGGPTLDPPLGLPSFGEPMQPAVPAERAAGRRSRTVGRTDASAATGAESRE